MKSPASEPGLRRFVSSSLSVSPCPPECCCGRFSGQENAFDERNRENGSDLDNQPQDQSVN